MEARSKPNSLMINLILDNIRSIHNVGSIFRTAETLGISKIYCIGTTPTPLDRFGNKRKDFAKVSLGAEDSIKWEYVENVDDVGVSESLKLIKRLKKEGYKIIALEQAPNSVDYKDVNLSKYFKNGLEIKVVIILGNEVDGVAKDLLEASNIIAEIPMRGKKESLNVSISAGIFLYRLLDN